MSTTTVSPEDIAAQIVAKDADVDGNEALLRAIMADVTTDDDIDAVLAEVARLRSSKHVVSAFNSGVRAMTRSVAKVGDREAVLSAFATIGSGTKTGIAWPFRRAALAHRRHQAKVAILDERLSATK